MRIMKVDFALVLLVGLSLALVNLQVGGNRAAEEELFLTQATPSVASLPVNLGNWRMVDEDPLTERVLAILKCQQHVNRTYLEESSGKQVGVTVLLGPAGPMVAHSPEVCLGSAQFELLEASEPIRISASDGKELVTYRATFKSKELGGQLLRVYYAWVRPDGTWVAPSRPRWELGGDVGLWKVQVSAVISEDVWLDSDGRPAQRMADSTEVQRVPDAGEQFLIDNGSALRGMFAGYLTQPLTVQEND